MELPYPAANLPEAAIRGIRVSDHRKCKKFEHRSGAQRRLSLNLRRGTGWDGSIQRPALPQIKAVAHYRRDPEWRGSDRLRTLISTRCCLTLAVLPLATPMSFTSSFTALVSKLGT